MSIVNKVAQSGLVTLKLEDFAPQGEIVAFDLAPFLFKGLILREKDFRQAMADQDWSLFEGKVLAVFCSADAIIPVWAYMLVAVQAQPKAAGIYFGSVAETETRIFLERIRQMDLEPYRDARVVVKGCADKPVPEAAFLEVTRLLRPIVQSLMFGEPCSTVPLYKRALPRTPEQSG
ncbi:MAG: DUF2480 family protein [Bacteroidetes bacterium]|nr:DUF2480 family protein [Bacteroidota bacterium]